MKNNVKEQATTTIEEKMNISLFHLIQKVTKKNIKQMENFSFKNKKYDMS